ncbi:MAG: hypothetical protein ACP5RJ_06425 [Conexivisphaera sp.]
MSEGKVYYRDSLGRRRVLRPSTIHREVKCLPCGYHMAIFWADRDEIEFGGPLSPWWHPIRPYILEVAWDLDEEAAKDAYHAILDARQEEARE